MNWAIEPSPIPICRPTRYKDQERQRDRLSLSCLRDGLASHSQPLLLQTGEARRESFLYQSRCVSPYFSFRRSAILTILISAFPPLILCKSMTLHLRPASRTGLSFVGHDD